MFDVYFWGNVSLDSGGDDSTESSVRVVATLCQCCVFTEEAPLLTVLGGVLFFASIQLHALHEHGLPHLNNGTETICSLRVVALSPVNRQGLHQG